MAAEQASTNRPFVQLVRETSAWLPMAMSAAGLVLVIGYVALVGNVRHEDEGTPAHVFQLLMTAQIPVVAYFALKWLPRNPWGAIRILAVQGLLWLAAVAAVLFFESVSIS